MRFHAAGTPPPCAAPVCSQWSALLQTGTLTTACPCACRSRHVPALSSLQHNGRQEAAAARCKRGRAGPSGMRAHPPPTGPLRRMQNNRRSGKSPQCRTHFRGAAWPAIFFPFRSICPPPCSACRRPSEYARPAGVFRLSLHARRHRQSAQYHPRQDRHRTESQ